MISPHIKDRFFQRYGVELTVPILRSLMELARAANGIPDAVPGRERVTVQWQGSAITIVWSRERRYFFTFLPPADPGMRRASSPPKRKRRR